jgi:Na+/H+-translocating membrane pyrophosphatase
LTHGAAAVPVIGPLLDGLAMPLCNALVGLLAGAILLGVATSISRVNRPRGGRNSK